MKNPFSNPFILFLVKAAILYIGWELLYELWLHPNRTLELLVVSNITLLVNGILELLGFALIDPDMIQGYDRTLGIDGTHGLYIADSCAGVPLMALFAGFILAYPGSTIRKLIYIPIGLIIIHLINILRIVGLAIVTLYAPEMLDFNHHYAFTIIVYTCIFLLWILWVNRFSKPKSQ
jgi:exosortase family protein XrtF